MLTLHFAPDNASLILRIALLELGQPFETVLVDRSVRAQDRADYRALNPTGLIPVLETPEGPLFETGAILLWLVDQFGQIGPQLGQPGRADFLKWLFFLSNTVHADLRQVFYPDQYVPQTAKAAHHALITARLLRHFLVLDPVVAARPDLFGAGTALSIYLLVLARWARLYPTENPAWLQLDTFPALARLAATCDGREAVRAAAQAEGIGPSPFVIPSPCHPTVGSVL